MSYKFLENSADAEYFHMIVSSEFRDLTIIKGVIIMHINTVIIANSEHTYAKICTVQNVLPMKGNC
jgi:hypothetical protein